MRAGSILTKNERNKHYTDDKNILSPDQTESAVKYESIITSYTKGTVNAVVRETIL